MPNYLNTEVTHVDLANLAKSCHSIDDGEFAESGEFGKIWSDSLNGLKSPLHRYPSLELKFGEISQSVAILTLILIFGEISLNLPNSPLRAFLPDICVPEMKTRATVIVLYYVCDTLLCLLIVDFHYYNVRVKK